MNGKYGIFKLDPTRTRRTYSGGKLIDEWYSLPSPQDSNRPEAWIASTTVARNPGMPEIADEGLSKITCPAGFQDRFLKDLIAEDPVSLLGSGHHAKHGTETGVLVKIIDSLERLTIQVHPDRKFAREVFKSNHGKTEAWYILGGRETEGEKPYVLFGFKEGITRQYWQEVFDRQDKEAMLNCLHKLYIKPGDAFFIEGGVPHAIGPGCFLIEVQEPTDFTLRTERTTPKGTPIPDELCHQGAGFKALFDTFHYNGYSLEETLKKWQLPGRVLRQDEQAKVTAILGPETTDLFSMDLLEVMQDFTFLNKESFSIMVVTAGAGSMSWQGESMEIGQGDFLFIPACLGEVQVKTAGDKLSLIECRSS